VLCSTSYHYMERHKVTISKLKHCVYVLYRLSDHHFYIGYSTNLEQRLTEHASGKSASTASRRPFQLIFCEYYFSKRDALRRERYFKTTAGKRTPKLMLQTSMQEISLQTDLQWNVAKIGSNFFEYVQFIFREENLPLKNYG
jgi:putative endonuclease